MKIDDLCNAIKKTRCPICVGLDTSYEYLTDAYKSDSPTYSEISKSIYKYNCDIINAVKDIAPSVKVQVAYYEQYGYHGMKCFFDTMSYASDNGLIVIADVKRNDIGSTAKAYSTAYIVNSAADFITVNAYLGIDGIQPFLEDCEQTGKGIFALVKTSNPSGGQFQDLDVSGKKLYQVMADKVSEWGSGLVGDYGYSSVGAVVGATYPQQAQELRQRMNQTFFLVPGYGAQGAGADDIAVNFDKQGLGGVVNSSRGILLAYKKEMYSNVPGKAARQAVLDMKQDILAAFSRCGVEL
ncbi:MAG: orotidine-5'-phosphate decarboxylase [Clostridia bacterium]|jgi:orotidine-5'-phosphate decarboxylase|nr:orotidine-5'-phosphate decarboxylase [Clostridia bacterium]